MDHKIVYKCEGPCQGVSDEPQNCGDPSCTHYNQPFKEHVQCEACAAAVERDGRVHACPNCPAA